MLLRMIDSRRIPTVRNVQKFTKAATKRKTQIAQNEIYKQSFYTSVKNWLVQPHVHPRP